jgi:hypothetical protein
MIWQHVGAAVVTLPTSIIEEQQDAHLVSGHVELMTLGAKLGFEICMTHVGLPGQLPP